MCGWVIVGFTKETSIPTLGFFFFLEGQTIITLHIDDSSSYFIHLQTTLIISYFLAFLMVLFSRRDTGKGRNGKD